MASQPASGRTPRDGFTAALGLLSVFPAGRGGLAVNAGRRGVKWFPAVGVVIGSAVTAVCALTYLALQRLGVDHFAASMLAGLAGTLADFTLTRGMHWDGLADVADAWWGGFDVARRLEIMSDSAVGTYGVFALISTFLALTFGLTLTASLPWVLIPAYGISRLAGVFAAQLGKPAKPGGLGESVLAHGTTYERGAASATTWSVAIATCCTAAGIVWLFAGLPLGFVILASAAASTLASAAFPHLIAQRMGGVTGDVIGASILLTQVVAVVVSAIALLIV